MAAPVIFSGRKWRIAFLSAIAVTLVVVAVWPRLDFVMRTGRFSPVERIETLQHPIGIRTWTANALVLEDGRLIAIPGIQGLPVEAEALSQVLKRGVEISPDGRVYGLVRIHHWCGNDPGRNHIVKVDVSKALTFLHLGTPTTPVPEADRTAGEEGGDFSKWGWNKSEYLQFQLWLARTETAR